MRCCVPFFFFNDTATTEIYTLSLHDALPISIVKRSPNAFPNEQSKVVCGSRCLGTSLAPSTNPDRKSTRLNSSHQIISYAVFCLKKKTSTPPPPPPPPHTPPPLPPPAPPPLP